MSHHSSKPDRLREATRRSFGEYPDGRLNENDAGAIAVEIGHEEGRVIIRFPKPVAWIGFTGDQAVEIASSTTEPVLGRIAPAIAINLIRTEPHYRRAAFDEGLKRAGHTLVTTGRPSGPDDLLVMWNRHKGAAEERAAAWEKAGGTVLVAENGYLQKVDKTMYAISTGQHNGAGWFPVGTEDRFSALGFEVKPWRVGGSEIVVRAQRGIGSRIMASPQRWADDAAVKLRARTKVPVRVAPHPGDKDKLERDQLALFDAQMLVIWSSALGVRALVNGIPVLYAAPHWICEAAATKVDSFPFVKRSDDLRATALHRMTHGQHSVSEIASGEVFMRMREGKWGRK